MMSSPYFQSAFQGQEGQHIVAVGVRQQTVAIRTEGAPWDWLPTTEARKMAMALLDCADRADQAARNT